MSRVIEYVKRLVRREPVMVRSALGLVVGYVVTLFHLDPTVEASLLTVLVALVATWARANVTPYARPRGRR